jgi:hypothetical protein
VTARGNRREPIFRGDLGSAGMGGPFWPDHQTESKSRSHYMTLYEVNRAVTVVGDSL